MERLRARSVVWFLGGVLVMTCLPAVGGEVRVLFWYDRARPLDTFKFQAYDLRKQEFTPEVDLWLKATKARFPGYEAYTRDIDLSRERGATDQLKIGSAITREFLGVGDRYGYQFGAYTGPVSGATGGTGRDARPDPLRPLTRPGPAPLRPVERPASSPFPVPYPRPHP